MIFNGGDEPLWVDGKEVGFFLVRVDFPVLVGNATFLKSNPDTLDERTELYIYGCIVSEMPLTW